MRIALAVLTLVMMPATAHAVQSEAERMMGYCISLAEGPDKPGPDRVQNIINGSMCSGFLQGFHYAQEIQWVSGVPKLYCLDMKKISTTQQAAIVLKYMRDNPEQWHEGFSLMVARSLAKAFPCN